MTAAVSGSLWTNMGAWFALIGLAALGVAIVIRFARRSPSEAGGATREFLVTYHQIQHETYEQQRPFARLRAWVQAEAAGLTPAAGEFESAGQEFLTLGLDGVRRFGATARALGVSGSTVGRLGDETSRLETALRGALARDGDDRLRLAREVVQRMEKVSGACLDAYLQIAERSPCHAGAEVRLVVESTSSAPHLRRIRFRVDTDPQAERGVLFDPAALRSVAGELIRNAARAVERVSEPEIEIAVRPHPSDPRYIQVVVSDNGPGIPEDLSRRLLRPGTSTRPDGGFGLARSSEIARSWLGDLDVGNRPEGGAVAALTVRVLAAEAVAREAG
jgi:signal transduction histidine kinase